LFSKKFEYMRNIFVAVLLLIGVYACKKNYNAEPTYAKQALAATWAKYQPFYQPKAKR